MKKIINILILFIFTASYTNAQSLISADEVASTMKNTDWVVVCCSKASTYNTSHIMGAIHIYHDDLTGDGSIKGVLKSSSEIADILGKKGLTTSKTIVLYDDNKGKYAGRMYWILKYMGCSDVRILDGQIAAWTAAKKRVTKVPTNKKKETFSPKVNSSLSASMSDVQSGKYVLVDARSAAEFNGTEGKVARKGHIPDAKNIEWSDVVNSTGKFKSKSEIISVFSKKGVTSSKPVILYCETSVRAGILYFALKEIAGFSNVKVYDGAYNEWISKSSNKVEK